MLELDGVIPPNGALILTDHPPAWRKLTGIKTQQTSGTLGPNEPPAVLSASHSRVHAVLKHSEPTSFYILPSIHTVLIFGPERWSGLARFQISRDRNAGVCRSTLFLFAPLYESGIYRLQCDSEARGHDSTVYRTRVIA